MPRRELRALRWPLLGNAVGLVFLTVLAGGYGLHWLIPALPLSVAFAIAAVVSPTDAVAISAITGRIAVPARLMHLLESEALLNDASGLVAFRFAVAATLTGAFSLPHAAASFLLIALGGLGAGWAITMAYARLNRLLVLYDSDPPLQAALSVLLPFAAYWVAEELHVSGILAAVAAGVTANWAGLLENAPFKARMQSGSLWLMINYCFNAIIFVLLGTQLPGIVGPSPGGVDLTSGAPLLPVLGQVGALMGLLIFVRLVWVMLSFGLARVTGARGQMPEWRIVLAASLAGVRGAITLAGVLTLPLALGDGTPFPGRDLAITLSTGVILASLLIAAIFLPLLLRGVRAPDHPMDEEIRQARIVAAEAALVAIEASGESGDRRDAVRQAYRQRLARLRDGPGDAAEEAAWRTLHQAALHAERAAVQGLRDRNAINDDTARLIIGELDVLEAASVHRPLRLGAVPGDVALPAESG